MKTLIDRRGAGEVRAGGLVVVDREVQRVVLGAAFHVGQEAGQGAPVAVDELRSAAG